MGNILGIDVGGSTTKIVGFREGTVLSNSCDITTEPSPAVLSNSRDNTTEPSPCVPCALLGMLQVRAADQVTSMYGAIGNLLSQHDIKLSEISTIYLTGVGASFIDEQIYGIKTIKVAEFNAIGRGALNLTGLDEALVISMGTGTAFVKATKNEVTHLGGSGMGGGTIIGLASQMLGKRHVDSILALAENGNLKNIDLSVSDILNSEVNTLPFDLTASNFGKMKSTASDSDIALGIINMVFETAGMMAVFALKDETIKDVVITGSLAEFPQAKTVLQQFNDIKGLNFIIPENAVYATAIGAMV